MPNIRSLPIEFALLIAIVMGSTPINAQAQAGPSHALLIGAPVFAADGIKIGQVADISVTTEGHIDHIRVFTGSTLAFGERIVAIPEPAFIIRGGTVTLPNLTSDDVESLPSASSENISPHSKER